MSFYEVFDKTPVAFISIIWINPQTNPMELVPLFYHFYRWGTKSLEKLGNLPKRVAELEFWTHLLLESVFFPYLGVSIIYLVEFITKCN